MLLWENNQLQGDYTVKVIHIDHITPPPHLLVSDNGTPSVLFLT